MKLLHRKIVLIPNKSGVGTPPKIDGGVRRKIQEKKFSSKNSVKKIPLQIQKLRNYQNLIPKKIKKKEKIVFIYTYRDKFIGISKNTPLQGLFPLLKTDTVSKIYLV